ncbi:hypothetical protein [Massilia sp. Se16.2.3]|uniref:hypothetical protein n=1 Tax=Massilia sp. Se16.2.3 TaxID=2709303 RepID=UPI001600C1B8|nr:hypothetical protein [Massilia sp. Se16.2.3]QNB00878.1 hypothetical protein G4G31_22080 [Massilia sp. Se16.2.3]
MGDTGLLRVCHAELELGLRMAGLRVGLQCLPRIARARTGCGFVAADAAIAADLRQGVAVFLGRDPVQSALDDGAGCVQQGAQLRRFLLDERGHAHQHLLGVVTVQDAMNGHLQVAAAPEPV